MYLNLSFKSTCTLNQYFLEKQKHPVILLATHAIGSWGSQYFWANEAASGWLVQGGAGNTGAGNDSSNFAPGLERGCLHSCLKGPSPHTAQLFGR